MQNQVYSGARIILNQQKSNYNVIKNMRSNYKYPYYTFNYSIVEKLRYVIGCNVHLYKGRDEMMSPSYFITNYLKNKLEQPNRYT